MPTATMRLASIVPADTEEVFAYVSDLTKHGEWSANLLEIMPLDGGEIAAGRAALVVAQVQAAAVAVDVHRTVVQAVAGKLRWRKQLK